MTQQDAIARHIHSFIFQQFPGAKSIVSSDDVSLLDTGVIDSLGVLDIVSFLESEFGLTLDDDDLVAENFQSISVLTDFVSRKLLEEDIAWTS